MKKMTVDRCVEIVESAIKKDSTEPVRIDFHPDQLEEIRSAHEKLFYRNGEFEEWFLRIIIHPKEEFSQRGFWRAAFIGPEGPWPIKVVDCPGETREEVYKELEQTQRRLQAEYGNNYKVQTAMFGGEGSSSNPCCKVWRGADCLRWETATHTCKEISASIKQLMVAQYRNREMKALADRKRAGEEMARQEGRVGHRAPKKWKDKTLKELLGKILDKNRNAGGREFCEKLAKKYDDTWRWPTIARTLREMKKERRAARNRQKEKT